MAEMISSFLSGRGGGNATGRRTKRVPFGAFWLLISGGLGAIVLYSFQFSSLKEALSVISIGTLVSGASLATGGLVGFLFGIPKWLENGAPQPPPNQNQGAQAAPRSQAAYGANTNLEQISDWLTKVLVGAGLTQVTRLPDEVGKPVDVITPGLGALSSSDTLALGLLIYYLACGFLLGYLWTRADLPGILNGAELTELTDELTRIEASLEQIARDMPPSSAGLR